MSCPDRGHPKERPSTFYDLHSPEYVRPSSPTEVPENAEPVVPPTIRHVGPSLRASPAAESQRQPALFPSLSARAPPPSPPLFSPSLSFSRSLRAFSHPLALASRAPGSHSKDGGVWGFLWAQRERGSFVRFAAMVAPSASPNGPVDLDKFLRASLTPSPRGSLLSFSAPTEEKLTATVSDCALSPGMH